MTNRTPGSSTGSGADTEQLIPEIPRSSIESHLGELLTPSVAKVLDFDGVAELRGLLAPYNPPSARGNQPRTLRQGLLGLDRRSHDRRLR